MERHTIEAWIEEYFRCWREKDADAVARLFTQDAVYRSSPFRQPLRGSEAIRSYWNRATASQVGFRIRIGDLVFEQNRAAVEWWATWTEEGAPVTLPGCLVLRFEQSGRCEELREYWHTDSSARDPPEGWGQ